MPAYCDVDGVPCHASRELLTTILRDEWGFDGIVASDYTAVQMLVGAAPPDRRPGDGRVDGAARRAWTASCRRPPATRAPLDRGDRGRPDRRVARRPRRRARSCGSSSGSGCSSSPYVDAPSDRDARPARGRGARARRRARARVARAARERRRAAAARRTAVASRSSARSPTARATSWATTRTCCTSRRSTSCATGEPVRLPVERRHPAGRRGRRPGRRSWARIRERFGTSRVTYARGTGLREGTDAEIDEAVELAPRRREVAIVVVGERSGLTVDATTGEFRDRRDLALLGRQQELLERVVATGTPTVLLVVSGRPLALEWAATHCAADPARLGAGRGRAGGDRRRPRRRRRARRAAADHHAAPRRPGPADVPPPPDRRPVELEGRLRRRLRDAAVAVRAWPLVHDLRPRPAAGRPIASWTPPATSSRSASTSRTRARGPATRSSSCTCATRRRPSRGPSSSCSASGASTSRPGECRTVTFRLSTEQLAYSAPTTGASSSPGAIRLFVGRSSADLPLSEELPLVGRTVELVERSCYHHRGERRPARADASTSGAAGRSPFDVARARSPSIAGDGRRAAMLRSPAQPCGRIDGATNVQDLAPLFQIVIVIAAVVSPIRCSTRVLRGDEPPLLRALFYVADVARGRAAYRRRSRSTSRSARPRPSPRTRRPAPEPRARGPAPRPAPPRTAAGRSAPCRG